MVVTHTKGIEGKRNMRSLRIHYWFSLPLLAITLLYLATPLAAHADGGAPNLAYVSGAAKGISVVDVAQQKVTNTLATPTHTGEILLSADARFLYVTEPDQGRMTAYAAKTGDVLCSANIPGHPTLLSLDAAASTLYVAGNGANSVSALDTTNCSIKRTLQTSGPVYGMALAFVGSGLSGGTGNQLWVASDALTIFDTTKGQQIGTVSMSGKPGFVSIPPGATVYTTNRNGSIDAIDLNSHKVLPLVSGGSYGPMDFNETTGEVYVPDRTNNQLVILAPVNAGFAPPKEPSRVLKLGVAPESIAITSDGQFGFAALSGGNVAMIDIPGHQVANTIFVGGNPTFIITGLYPPLLGTTPQQATIYGTILNIAAYAFVIALFIVPIILFRRYAKANATDNEAADTEAPREEEKKV